MPSFSVREECGFSDRDFTPFIKMEKKKNIKCVERRDGKYVQVLSSVRSVKESCRIHHLREKCMNQLQPVQQPQCSRVGPIIYCQES